MTTDDLDSGEARMIDSKIRYTEKQAAKALEDGNEELVKKYIQNIEHYKSELAKII